MAGWRRRETLESILALSREIDPTYESETGSSTGRTEDIVEALVRSRNPSHLHHHPHPLLDGLRRSQAESTIVTDTTMLQGTHAFVLDLHRTQLLACRLLERSRPTRN
jgi:hypothetical protein